MNEWMSCRMTWKTRVNDRIWYILTGILIIWASTATVWAKPAAVQFPPLSYADAADLVTASPVILKGKVKSASRVKVPVTGNPEAVRRYLHVRVAVDSLIRGQDGVPPQVSLLAFDSEGTNPDVYRPRRGQTVLIFAQRSGRPGEMRLVSRHALRPWTAELEAMTRSITAELLKPDAAPAIVAIGDAFHVAGTVAGESETQIFLKTGTNAPVSISVVRRPGQQPRWGVSLDEVVDDTAVPPAPGTLLRYRLACGLPDRLPPQSTRSLPLADAEAAQRDYGFVIESLGSCGRTL